MIKWLWDLLFTRTVWTQISGPHRLENPYGAVGARYIVQNQWGRIKKVDCI